MKDYKKVVEQRYDAEKYDGKALENNIYSLINPVGYYGGFKVTQILSDFIKMINLHGTPIDKIKVCDCGCGTGLATRFLAELLWNPKQVYGVEYSENRLSFCRKMNPNICYAHVDLTKKGEGIPFDILFDGITVFVVFMHFVSEHEIINALENIHSSLKHGGLFLWYEVNAKSHREGEKHNIDHWGFSADEMDRYASMVGFDLIKHYNVYTRIPIVNIATIYAAKRIKHIWILELLEKLPFKKNNHIRIYYKK